MCGIAGIVNLNGQPVAAPELERMSRIIAHRGPDGEGIFYQTNVGLAHRRLAIIDPRTGAQPIFSDDRRIVLIYNGEVYNYLEIRRELAAEFDFRTQSDTEVVLRAYEKWGISCLERFRGMFAFALYDQAQSELYLVRDRVGIKPLFYYHTPEWLIFGSEVLACLSSGHVQRDIAPESLSGYFRYQYIPTPATVYKNLYKLEPGHYLRVDTRGGHVSNHQYWNLTIRQTERSETDWLEQLNALLDETIRIYVRSDVPFGAFLSGGIDSSLVTAVMSRHLSEPVRTFTIGFREEKHSELPFAAEASRAVGTCHHEKIVSPDLAVDVLQRLVTHFGEPFADSSAIPTYYVSRETAQSVKMVLSGDGGDELFGGYNSYQTTFRDYTHTARASASRLLNLLARCGFPRLGQQMRERRISPYQPQHDAARQIFDDAGLRGLLNPGLPVAPPTEFRVNIDSPDIDPVTYFQAQDFKTYMVDDVLTKVDRMSMANSLEVRVPLLDHKVVEFAFTLPLEFKLRNAEDGRIETKYLLKRSASRFYSPTLLARPKQGFGIPVQEWCEVPFRPLIEAGLRDAHNPIYDWVRFDYVQKLLDEYYAGEERLVVRVWFLFMLDLWGKNVHRTV